MSRPSMEFATRRFDPLAALAALMLLAPAVHAAIAPGPYYARGDFYYAPGSPGSTPEGTWGYSPAQQLFDDGLHGDGAANDGVYGADIPCNMGAGYHEFKIANADWSFAEPTAWYAPLVNGRVFPDQPGEVIHFRLDLNGGVDGWLPYVAVANDHGYPSWASLEVIGSALELGSWNFGLPADHIGSIWSKTVRIETPGAYEFKFRVLGSWTWVDFGLNYNNNSGYNGYFDVTTPNELVTIQFDEFTGRIRAVPGSATPARRNSWGGLKAAYR